MTQPKIPRDNLQDILDLTPVQAGMLYQCLLEPEAGHYHVSVRLRLAGPLDPARARRAWNAVAARHPALRTVFRWQDVARPVQIVLRHHRVAFEVIDLCGAVAAEVAAARARLAAPRFDLAEVPFRVTLLRLDETSHEMIVQYHHIICDGWSVGILVRELFAAYGGAATEAAGGERLGFKDHVKRTRRRDPAAEAAFWTRYFDGYEASGGFAIRRAVGAGGGGRHTWQLDAELQLRLDELCRSAGVTPAAVLFACWGLVLARYNDVDDVVFGTTVSGRAGLPVDASEAVGCFINTLPLRIVRDGRVRFRELVAQVSRDLAARSAHEATPLAELRRHARLEADEPLFDTVIAIENYPLDGIRGALPGGLELAEARFDERSSTPLTVIVQPGAPTTVTFLHDASVAGDAVALLEGHVRNLLRAALAGPDVRVGECDILGPEHRAELAAFNATARPYPRTLLHRVLEQQAARTPAARAAFDGERELSYAELDGRANQLARRLRALGVGRGDLVAIACPRSLELLVGIFGVLKAGAAYLPLDPAAPAERRDGILAASRAKLVLTLGGSPPGAHDVVDLADPALLRGDASDLALDGDPDDVAYVIYTSGSTGRPKGVVIRHGSAVNRLDWMQRAYGFQPDDILLQKTPTTFDVSVWELFLWAFAGAAVRVLPDGDERDPRRIVDAVASGGVTTIHFVPSMLSAFLAYLQGVDDVARLASLRRIFASGEALEPSHVEAYRSLIAARHPVRLINLYGPTEATVDVTHYDATDHRGGAVPIGRPIQNTRLHVLSRSRQEQPAGVTGELAIAGDALAVGYLGDPEQTAAKFIPSPVAAGERLYLTGDLARWRSDGCIEYLGRVDHQVKLRGYRIELGEIEQTILRVPGTVQAGVILCKTPSGSELAGVFTGAAAVTPSAVRAVLGRHLPPYMIPGRLYKVDALPSTSSGKLDRRALHRLIEAADRAAAAAPPAPAGPAVQPAAARSRAAAELYDEVRRAWQEVLPGRAVSLHDRFFEVGGDSLSLIRLMAVLAKRFGDRVTIPKLSQYPSIQLFADYLLEATGAGAGAAAAEATAAEAGAVPAADGARHAIAIVGMAGRFPGAADVRAFWQALCRGEPGTSRRDPASLAAEVDPDDLASPRYVPVKGRLDDADAFDAGFFGYNAQEAQLMDPQLRVLHECVWHALEDAGVQPARDGAEVGLYVGGSPNLHWLVAARGEAGDFLSDFNLMLLSEKDFFSGRISHKLDLRGPSVTVQTSCSTSAVAIHEACQGLTAGHCRVAVAGGVSITLPLDAGYRYEDGMILSPDGVCRPFDAAANGTVPGNGAAVVVLKRLDDAIADGNSIYAVIKGGAINNDGARKLGFTAPSVDGQARCIREAHRRAGVSSASISYVETHGTGTLLGDAIELDALAAAFDGAAPGSCGIGSVKSNIGHLDAAAGVAGVIKTALALHHGVLPPTLHFQRPNPRIDLAHTPFYVVDTARAWPRGPAPRRAGVSSFGMSGTNCHLVLEEAAPRPRIAGALDELQVLPLSAATPEALGEARQRLAAELATLDDAALPDVAHTLQHGRRPMTERAAVIAASRGEAIGALAGEAPGAVVTGRAPDEPPTVIFLFQGQGRPIAQLGRELVATWPAYRAVVERCGDHLARHHGAELRDILAAAAGPDGAVTTLTPLALFVFQVAFAELLRAHGVQPAVVAGHSVGEYAAAALAGVFALEDALDALYRRCRLIATLPAGAMIATDLTPAEAEAVAGGSVALAAVNSPRDTVLSGEPAAIDRLAAELERGGRLVRRLATTHAFHSPMLDPILGEYHRALAGARLACPTLELVTCTAEQPAAERLATAELWAAQMRAPVLFAEAARRLASMPRPLVLEIGGKPSLLGHLRKQSWRDGLTAFGLVDGDERLDSRAVLRTLARLWTAGAAVAWPRGPASARRFVSLPGYPFARRRYPVRVRPARTRAAGLDEASVTAPAAARRPFADWFYAPAWDREPPAEDARSLPGTGPVVCFVDELGIGLEVARRLAGERAVAVRFAAGFAHEGERRFCLDPADPAQLAALLEQLGAPPDAIVHAALLRRPEGGLPGSAQVRRSLDHGYYALMSLGRALARRRFGALDLVVLTANAQDVVGGDALCPDQATIFGTTKVLPLEDRRVRCRTLDLDLRAGAWDAGDIAAAVAAALRSSSAATGFALRDGRVWAHHHRRIPVPAGEVTGALRAGGVHLVTGGLGGIGFEVAAHLARAGAARVILIGRSAPSDDRRRRIAELEAAGAEVTVVAADVTDGARLGAIVAEVMERSGRIDGVFHAAGIADYCGLLQTRDRAATEHVLAPKVAGTLNLLDALARANARAEVVVLFSSIGNVAYELKYGQSGYNAANELLDAIAAFAGPVPARRVVSINWPDWKDVGMSVHSAKLWARQLGRTEEALVGDALSGAEGMQALMAALATRRALVAISPVDLDARRAHAAQLVASLAGAEVPSGPAVGGDDDGGADLAGEIAAACRDVLGLDHIDPSQSFFELGASSFDLIRINTALRQRTGREIAIVEMYEHHSVHALAARLARGDAPGTEPAPAPAPRAAGKTRIARTLQTLKDKTRK